MYVMKRPLSIIAACLIVLILLLCCTNPRTLPAYILVVPFIALFIALFTTLTAILEARGMARGKTLRTAVLCTVPPMLLLVMQSIGQLTVRDVITVGALFLLSYFYMSRTSTST